MRSDGTERPARYKVRAPTLGNIPAVCDMLTSKADYTVNIGDIPIVLASIDPCFSCTDRAIKFIDPCKQKEWIWSHEQLERYSRKEANP